MAPYIVLNVILACLWLLYISKKDIRVFCIGQRRLFTEANALEWLAAAIIALFMGLRYPFTQDHRNYIIMFDETIRRSVLDIITNKGYTESGYLLFNKAIGLFTSNANIFMLIEALLYVVIIVKVAKRYSQIDCVFFMLLFVNAGIYFHAFNLVRQALAGAIVFIAIRMLGNGNIKGYLVVIVLAATIHISSLIMLPIMPLLVQKVNIKNSVKMIAIGSAVVLALGKIIELVQRYRYKNYSFGMGKGTINAFLVQWSICLFIIIAIYKGMIDLEDRHNVVLVNCMWIYLIFSIATLSVYQMSRICYFFSTPMLLLASEAFSKIRGKIGVLIRNGVVLVLVLYTYVWLSGTGYDPYSTFFS